MALERVGELVMLEAIREREPATLAGVGVEIGQHFVHAAMLGVEHARDLLVVERREHALGPSGELSLDVERRAIARVAIARRAVRRTSCAACTTATRGR